MEQLRTPLPYTSQIFCPYHKDQLIQRICIDNHCGQKALCFLCEVYSREHNTFPLNIFYNSLNQFQMMEFTEEHQFDKEIIQSVEGAQIDKKLTNYNQEADQARQEYKQMHMDIINRHMNRLQSSLNHMVEEAKVSIVSMYEKMNNQLFSQHSLQEKEFKDKACRLVMKALQGEDYLQLNASVRKLHTGGYELAYAKQKVIDIFNSITRKIEDFIQNTEQLVNHQIKEFQQVFKMFERKQSLLKSKLFRRAKGNSPAGKSKTRLGLTNIMTPLYSGNHVTTQNFAGSFQSYAQAFKTESDEPANQNSMSKFGIGSNSKLDLLLNK